MIVSIIVSCTEQGIIGKDGNTPWTLPEDLKFFEKKTTGSYAVMGRITFESIVKKLGNPLPRRDNIVITSQPNYQYDKRFNFGSKFLSFTSLGSALEHIQRWELMFEGVSEEFEVFIVGGQSIYEHAFQSGIVDNIYQTVIHKEFDGDRYFKIPQGYERTTYQKKTYSEKADLYYSILRWFKDPSEIQGWVNDGGSCLFPDKHIINK